MDQQIPWTPVSLESEEDLLGALLLNSDAYSKVSDLLEPNHFSEPLLGHIYEIIGTLINAGKLANVITVQSYLPPMVEGTKTKTKQYLARLAANASTIINAPDYAKHIREMANRRRISEIARQMAPDAATEASQIASEAIEHLDAIITAAGSGSLPAVQMGTAMTRAIDGIAKAYQSESKIIGIPTGLKDLDAKMGGLCAGDLIVIGGRPGMGKSALLTALLRNAARKGYRCMANSLEMSAEQLAERMISDTLFDMSVDNVPYSALRTGNFHEKLFQYIRDAAEMNHALPITIEEQPYLTMSQIATRARRLKRRGGLDLLAIDHLDLVKPSGRYAGNKVYELGEITAACKALAKELAIPVILLCQLSRDVEKREDKRPMLSDLRSSGSIEQDADAVIFLYRPSYYLQNNEPKGGTPEYVKWVEDVADAHNKLVAIIAKQRMGPVGPVELFCDIANNAVRDMGARG